MGCGGAGPRRGCAPGAAFCAGAGGAGRGAGGEAVRGCVRAPRCWRRDRMCSLPPRRPPCPVRLPARLRLQKSSSSASSEASETCQSVSECSSPTSVSAPDLPGHSGRDQVRPEGYAYAHIPHKRTSWAPYASAPHMLTSSLPPAGQGAQEGLGTHSALGALPSAVRSGAQGPPDPPASPSRTGPRPAPTSSPQAPRCSGGRTAWSSCETRSRAQPAGAPRAPVERRPRGPACPRPRSRPR